MATITIQETHTASTCVNFLSAFGPNISKNYNTLKLSTVQSPVTAIITDYVFSSPNPFGDGPVFTLPASGIGTCPITIHDATPNTAYPTWLIATVKESALGVISGTLALTLSATCLSGAAGTRTTVTNTSQTLTFTLTAVNKPFGNQISEDFHRRQRLLGII